MNLLIELDKAGAEWVCVAYLSGDETMISVVEGDISPHVVTGSLISKAPFAFIEKENKIVGNATDPDRIEELREPLQDEIDPTWWLPRTMSIRQCGKKSNHGLNYDMKYKRFALENEIPENEANLIVNSYHRDAYPGIKRNYHKDVQEQLNEDRTLTNCFGRKRRFMDAWGPDLFDAAYAFTPQSTVFDMTRLGLKEAYLNDSEDFKCQEPIAQVHDSIVFQVDLTDVERAARVVGKIGLDYMNPVCRYNNFEFQVDTTMKMGLDWSHMHECSLQEDWTKTAEEMSKVVENIKSGQTSLN